MRVVRHSLIVTACTALLALSAAAQTPQPAIVAPAAGAAAGPVMERGNPAMSQRRAAHVEQRRAQREANLKQILQITPDQEAAWNTWTAARRAGNPPRLDRAELARLSTPERLDRMRALRAARGAEMDRRAEATKAFYAALNPSQQKAFDVLSTQRWGRGLGGHHRGMHRG
jgi:periplasmic protein CpxP/Spy